MQGSKLGRNTCTNKKNWPKVSKVAIRYISPFWLIPTYSTVQQYEVYVPSFIRIPFKLREQIALQQTDTRIYGHKDRRAGLVLLC